MRLLRVFFVHELTTQIRSARFHGVSLAYLAVSTIPAIGAFAMTNRVQTLIGPQMYGALMDGLQPLATTLFSAAIAVDVIARERDENSLGVVAMAPVSATGYILRRWLALLALLLPITLLPRVAAIGLVHRAVDGPVDIAPILLGWAVHVLPLLIVITALTVALGTITSRTVLALLFGLGLFTIGLGITNDFLAFARRQLAGPGDFFGVSESGAIVWAIRGYIDVGVPTAAGFPLARELETLLIEGALAAGVATLFLGISCCYLRRTKRNLRPWRIPEDHRFRTFLRIINRTREEFAPDGGLEIPERIALVLALVVPIAALVMIDRRHHAFEALAAERYASLTTGVEPMPVTIVPPSAALRGRVTPEGELQATATIALRNDGTAAQRELAFALNRGIGIDRVSASRGAAKLSRVFERVGVALDPPLAPRETRSITFALRGAPGTYDFSLPGGKNFAASWRRYAAATKSFDLADLSRSSLRRDATMERLLLAGPTLIPVPRYTQWLLPEDEWGRGERSRNTFIDDEVTPPTDLTIDLELAGHFTAADSCGTLSNGRIASRCTSALGDYILIATRWETMTIPGADARLAFLLPHVGLAQSHARAIGDAIALAKKSWGTFALPERAVFVERPAYRFETYYGDWNWVESIRVIRSRGALNILPEPMFISLRPMRREAVAASLIANHMVSRREVVTAEQAFFRGFYETIAVWRTGGKKISPVESPIGGKPLTDPIIDVGTGSWRGPVRLRRVLADVEYRIGADRLFAGVEDFLSAGPAPGTAKELLDAIARRGGVGLDRVYADYFIGSALPRLTFADVTFTRLDDVWEVRGNLKNEAHGEAFCPIVLRTASGAVRTTVRVDAKASTPFVLRAPHEPRTLQLDPEKVVYRHAAVGLVDSIDYKGRS